MWVLGQSFGGGKNEEGSAVPGQAGIQLRRDAKGPFPPSAEGSGKGGIFF